MPVSRGDVLERVTATRDVQAQIAGSWVWEEMTVAQWDAQVTALRDSQDNEAAKRATERAKRATLDEMMDDLEDNKVQAVGMARYRWRNDAMNTALIDGLEEQGSGRDATISEARDWVKLWGEIDPAWNPTPTNTRTAFQTLLGACVAAEDEWKTARLTWRKAATQWNNLAAETEELCVAWYGSALRVFPEGSAEGDLIRANIPTFDNSGAQAPTPAPPSP